MGGAGFIFSQTWEISVVLLSFRACGAIVVFICIKGKGCRGRRITTADNNIAYTSRKDFLPNRRCRCRPHTYNADGASADSVDKTNI